VTAGTPVTSGTVTAGTPDAAGAPPPVVSPAAAPSRPAALKPISIRRAAAVSMLLLALLLLGFVGYLFGLSGIQEAGAQARLYQTFRNELGQDVGPLGPYGAFGRTGLGAPVAVLDIPSIGIRDLVVVQGTAPEQLRLGPGHLRNTPLPGQTGLSVVYGRRATFGAPFGRLGELQPGDEITALTQQGKFVYKVAAIGDSHYPVHDSSLNRLALLTASSSVVPSYYLEVDADLVSTPQNGPAVLPAIGPDEQAMAGDDSALALTMAWGLALVLVSVGGAVAATRWSVWTVYLVLVPAVLAILWNVYENFAAVLPNLF
jgi:sortase A